MATVALLALYAWAAHAEPRFGWDYDTSELKVIAISGVEQASLVAAHHAIVQCSRGICRIRITLQAVSIARIDFRYTKDRPFSKIEGIDGVDNRARTRLSLDHLLASGQIQRGRDNIEIHAQESMLDWTLQIVDYYR